MNTEKLVVYKAKTFGKTLSAESINKRPYDPTNNKTRGFKFLWCVTPDYWKEKWGPIPVLGYVRAYSEFHAKYAAYDKGLLPVNFTFGPKVTKQAPKKFGEGYQGKKT